MIDAIIPWWGWFVFGFALLLLELSAPGGFYFLFFGAGAIGVGILAWSAAVQEAWLQLTLFSILSIAASLAFRKRLLARFGAKSAPGRVDSLLGEVALVTADMGPNAFGKVELRGTTWSAKNIGAGELLRGERGRVCRVEGLSLWVKREDE